MSSLVIKSDKVDNEKMAKSGENFLTLAVLIEHGYDPLAYRYLCLGTHYRKQLAFSFEAMDGAAASLASLRNSIFELRGKTDIGNAQIKTGYAKAFLDAVTDDCNIAQGLAVLWDALGDTKLGAADKYVLALVFDQVLGLDLALVGEESIPDEVQFLVSERESARVRKDWVASDKLRDSIIAFGYEVRDTPQGPVVRPK